MKVTHVDLPQKGKRVAIEGLPAERPVCQSCGKNLRPWTDDTFDKSIGYRNGAFPIRRVFTGWQGYPKGHGRKKLFCTLRCAMTFAVTAHEVLHQEGRRPASRGAIKR